MDVRPGERGEGDGGGLLAAARRALTAELAALASLGRPRVPALARAHRPGLGLLCALLALGLYAGLGARVAEGRFLERYNQAFDYDPSRYVLLWTADPARWEEETHSAEYQVRHPYLRALSVVLRPLAEAGLGGELASTLFCALCGAGCVLCAWLLLRAHGAGVPESLVLTLFFATSTTQVLHSIAVESYAPTALGFALLYLWARLRVGDLDSRARGSLVLALASFGTTTTNIVQVGLTELCSRLGALRPRAALLRTAVFSALAGAGVLAALYLGGFMRLEDGRFDPVRIARTINYAGHFDDDGGKVGVERIAPAFLAFAFVAPRFARVPMKGEPDMLDFRAFDYPGWLLPSVALWLGVAALGAALSVARRETRWFGVALVAGVLFDFLLFWRYQYRQSVFLGASHAHFAAFALAAEPARRLTLARPAVRRAVLAAALVAVALAAAGNLQRLWELVAAFA